MLIKLNFSEFCNKKPSYRVFISVKGLLQITANVFETEAENVKIIIFLLTSY